jgi:HAD superfamily hydrolase (TIGR01509 family)
MGLFDLIIFDLDGVLVDSEGLSCGCLQKLLAESGAALDLPEIYERFLGRGFHAVADYLATLPSGVPADFRRRFEAEVSAAFRRALQPIPGISDLLQALRIPFCVASSSSPERIALSLTVTGLMPFFAGRIFTGESVPRGKPAPDLFLLAARTMGADPARCVVIEDSGPGMAAGRAAGMEVWAFAGGSHLAGSDAARRLAAFGAARVFDTMADLRRALTG